MRKDRTNPELIRAEVRKLTEGGKTRKVMACGHEEYVFASVDEKTQVCWACKPAHGPQATGENK